MPLWKSRRLHVLQLVFDVLFLKIRNLELDFFIVILGASMGDILHDGGLDD